MDRKFFGWWVSFAVLIATLLFAAAVIQYKRSAVKLTLTQTVTFDNHRLAIKIGDDFKSIAADRLPREVLAGWHVPATDAPAVLVFASRIAQSSQVPNSCTAAAIVRYMPIIGGRLAEAQITQTHDAIDGFSRVSVGARYLSAEQDMRTRDTGTLAIEILLLPDGSALEIAVAAIGRSIHVARPWAEALVQSAKYNVPDTIKIVPARSPIVLGGWQTTTERPVAMTVEPNSQTLRLTADSARADEFWTAQVRTMHLPAFRDGATLVREAISDLFTLNVPIKVAKPETINGLTVYRAEQTHILDPRMSIVHRQIAYAVVASNRSCMLIQVTVAGDNAEAIEKFWTWTIGNLRCNTPTVAPPMLDVRGVLSKGKLAAMSANVTGWYEFVYSGESVGFAIFAVESIADGTARARYFWYRDFGGSDMYFGHETATLSDFGKTMTSTIRDVLRTVPDRRLSITDVTKRIVADPQMLNLDTTINNETTSRSFPRCEDFIDTTSQLLLGTAAATSDAISPGTFSITTIDDFSATPASGTAIIEKKNKQTHVTFASDSQIDPGTYVYDAAGVLQSIDFGQLTIRRVTAEKIRSRFPRGSHDAMQWMQSGDTGHSTPATSPRLDAPKNIAPAPASPQERRNRADDPKRRTDADRHSQPTVATAQLIDTH